MFKFKKDKTEKKSSLLERFTHGLSKTRQNFTKGLGNLLLGKKIIDAELLEEIEMQLLSADVGVEATKTIIADLTGRLKRNELKDADVLIQALQEECFKILEPVQKPLAIDASKKPYVILMVGVNGSGKTTTIGKLAKQLQSAGKQVMLSAGDTFRAAAVEQLQVWGERNDIPVIAQTTGADSAAVVYDAMQSAKAKGMDVLIADTAGRLHTQHNLMAELEKVIRVIKKNDETAPHEIMLVLDAGIGQNALQQAKMFHKAAGVTGITMTKLDGTAKGGIIFAVASELSIPVRFIGIGEGIDDLRIFDSTSFVEALFNDVTDKETSTE